MRRALDFLLIGLAYWAYKARQEAEVLGEGVSVSYLADKGDGLIVYDHDFEEPLPKLEISDDDNLEFEGGGYEIYDSWIVG